MTNNYSAKRSRLEVVTSTAFALDISQYIKLDTGNSTKKGNENGRGKKCRLKDHNKKSFALSHAFFYFMLLLGFLLPFLLLSFFFILILLHFLLALLPLFLLFLLLSLLNLLNLLFRLFLCCWSVSSIYLSLFLLSSSSFQCKPAPCMEAPFVIGDKMYPNKTFLAGAFYTLRTF